MKPAYEDATVRLFHSSHQDLAAHLRETGEKVDALIVDAPYSERTHAGHDQSVGRTGEQSGYDHAYRRVIDYAAWGISDVTRFVAQWVDRVNGWVCSLTDHNLAPSWASALDAAGRYTFAPLACVVPGSRVRMLGDGPAQWSTFLICARPRSKAFASWGSLPGAYVVGPGGNDMKVSGEEPRYVTGGKPLSLMRALVRDYSRPGDLVCDPCCGASTTLLAARLEGRRAIGCDISAEHIRLSVDRLSSTPVEPRKGTLALFGKEEP